MIMEGKKQGYDWTELWKKDDWVSVWIGFVILILLVVGVKFSLPKWGWTMDGAFQSKVSKWSEKVDSLGKDADQMKESGLKTGVASLKSAIDAKNRADITKAAGDVEKIAKDVKDAGLKGKADKLAQDIKKAGAGTFGKMFSGENLLTALF